MKSSASLTWRSIRYCNVILCIIKSNFIDLRVAIFGLHDPSFSVKESRNLYCIYDYMNYTHVTDLSSCNKEKFIIIIC